MRRFEYSLTRIFKQAHALPMDALFTALAQPTRRQILDALRDGEQPVGALVGALELAQPTVSQHLRVLRDAGLVRVRRAGQQRLYRLDPEGLQALEAWLMPYRRVWADRLDALERHLDRMESEE